MWVTFSLRTCLRIALLMAALGLAATYHSGTCQSATITIQAGQNRPEPKRDEQTSQAVDTNTPLTGNTIFTYGQADASRLLGMDGLSVYPMTDFAIVYDGKAATPEASTWWMILTGALLIGAKMTRNKWQLVKATDASLG